MTRRRSALVAAILATLLAALGPATAAPALAAAPSLTIVSNATYTVDPDKAAVHVAVNLTVANHLTDTKTRLYYFDKAYLAVPPNTTGFKVSSRTGKPTVHVAAKTKDHLLLRIDFGSRLGSGQTRGIGLTFDIRDPGGVPTRTTRIGSSLVTFGAWAYGSEATPGSTVTVIFPAGFTIDAQGDLLHKPTTGGDGRTVFSTGALAQPLTFFAYFVADRPSAFTETKRTVQLGGRPLDILVRAWPDDPAWGERTGTMVEQGVPVLADAIGLPWVADRPFVVAEAVSQSGAGYAGKYDPESATVEIAYYASPLVTLHETAHAWFDGNLLADRWANEGFAAYYALDAAAKLKIKAAPATLTPEMNAAKIPLNAWGPIGTNEKATDAYGYAASEELARLVAERAGPTGLASVWSAIHDGVAAYQPPGLRPASGTGTGAGTGMAGGGAGGSMDASDAAQIERGTTPPDWRGLLDLLEDRTGKKYDDLWRVWVVRHEEAGLLDARASARRQYDAVVARAGEWRLPPIVREAMRAWQFTQAEELLTAANQALDDRDAVLAKASAAKLAAPRALEAAFESDHGFAAVSLEADAELATIKAYAEAASVREPDPGLIEQVGLWGTTPDADLAAAAAAFSAGDLKASVQDSADAFNAWDAARDTGRNRVMTMLAALIASIVAVAFIVNGVRGVASRRASRSRKGTPGKSGPDAGSGPPPPRGMMAHPKD
jgi:hypothetical protein